MKKITITGLIVMLTASLSFAGGKNVYVEPVVQEVVAEKSGGFYIGGFGGINIADDLESRASAGNIDVNIGGEYDAGLRAGGALGYKMYNSGIRIELEGSYSKNETDTLEVDIKTGTFLDSYLEYVNEESEDEVISIMLNIYKDFSISDSLSFYLGAGVGIASVERSLTYDTDFIGFKVDSTSISVEDEILAFQAIAGLEFGVTENIGLFAEYRFFGTEDIGEDDGLLNHSGNLGLRLYF